MNWINPKKRKPEGEVFWALTEGRDEQGHCDWVIRKLLNCNHGDYRSLDEAGAYFLPGTFNGQSWCSTLYAWLPLEAIPINEKEFEE